MEESKRENQSNEKDGPQQSDSDATSKETLEDLKDKDSAVGEQDEQHDAGVPSPDGAFDEQKEVSDSGPM
jgi:hypothetical protein